MFNMPVALEGLLYENLLEKCLTNNYPLFGAIAGDVVGSPYEGPGKRIKNKEFPLFTEESIYTDDSLLTLAIAKALIEGSGYGTEMRKMGNKYRFPKGGYGGTFWQWLSSDTMGPYNSCGNGSAMRVSAIGWAFDNLDQTLKAARKTAEVTHNHPEGIKGAEAVAGAIFMARTGNSKESIKEFVESTFQYNLTRSIDEIRAEYRYNEICQGTVPPAIRCFIDGSDFTDCIRNAVSLGGDSDTLAAIAGSIAEAYYSGVPKEIKEHIITLLPEELLRIIVNFGEKYKYWSSNG